MTPTELATLLDETNHHPWESVQAALDAAAGLTDPHLEWLKNHLVETKQNYWTLVAAATDTPAPPSGTLTDLMAWEVAAARYLTPEMLAKSLLTL